MKDILLRPFEGWEIIRSLEIRNWNTAQIGTARSSASAEVQAESIDLHSLFKDMKNLEVLILPEKFISSNVARIDHMFQDDTMLSLVMDISSPDSDLWTRATTLSSRTYTIGGVTKRGEASPIVSGWDQPDFTTWGFGGKWYLEDWDLTGVCDMSFLFANCWSLHKLDLRTWVLQPAYMPTGTTLIMNSSGTTQAAPALDLVSGRNMANPIDPTVHNSNSITSSREIAVNISAMFDGAGLEAMQLPNYPAVSYTPVPPYVSPTSVSMLNKPITCIDSGCALTDQNGEHVDVLTQ